MTPTQYEAEKAQLVAASDFQAALNAMRLDFQRKEAAAARAAAEAEAARIQANADLWGVVYADVKPQLPAWAQPFLVPHTDFQGNAPSLSATLDLVLPFEAGPWPISMRLQWHNPQRPSESFWKIEGDYYHREPYVVSYPRAYMDEDGEWQMDYRAAQFDELASAVLYAADAPARDAELRAENAAKNAEHARQAAAFHEEHKASPLTETPATPMCTAEERALLDALSAVIYARTAYEQ